MSSNKRVERAHLYANNELLAEVSNAKYSHDSNDEQGHGFDGALYWSTGNDTSELDFNTLVPKRGHAVNLKRIILNHEDVTMVIFVDGAFEHLDGRIVHRDYDFDSKSGMLKGNFKFTGSKPVPA